jgi:hypothetical protein
MGIVPLAFAVYGAVMARGVTRAYLVALAAAALLISFGKHFQPLYSLLYYHLPFFNKFRVPVMILVLVQFATAALAALGLTSALARPAAPTGKSGDSGSPWMRAALLSAVAGFGALFLMNLLGTTIRAYAVRSRPNFDLSHARAALDMASIDAIKCGLFLAAALAVVGMARRSRLTPSVAALLIVGITVADLWTIDRKIIDPLVATAREYDNNFRETPEVTLLRSDSTQFRVSRPLGRQPAGRVRHRIGARLPPGEAALYQGFVDTVGIQTFRNAPAPEREVHPRRAAISGRRQGWFCATTGGEGIRGRGSCRARSWRTRSSKFGTTRGPRDDPTHAFDPHAEVL